MHGAVDASTFEGAGAVLAVVLNAPQAWRSCVAGQVDGLSPAARWLAVLQSTTWVAFGLTGGGAVQVLTNTVCGLLHVGVLVALLALAPAARARRVLVPQAAASAAWTALVLLAATTAVLPVGLLAALCGTAALVPQLVHLARADPGSASGLSPATAVLTVVSSACWTSAGLLGSGPAVWVPSGLGLLAGATTLALLQRPAGGTPVPPPAPAPLPAGLVPTQRRAGGRLVAVRARV